MNLTTNTAVQNEFVHIDNKKFVPFITSKQIEEVIKERAGRISKECMAKGIEPVFVVVLNGAFIFASDFLRHLSKDLVCYVEFMKLSSYRGMQSQGSITNHLSLKHDIKGKTVYILEDIVDTGTTMDYLIRELKLQEPAEIQLLPLIFKPEALKFDLGKIEACFEIPDKFIVGYGLDCNGVGRHLADIYILDRGTVQ